MTNDLTQHLDLRTMVLTLEPVCHVSLSIGLLRWPARGDPNLLGPDLHLGAWGVRAARARGRQHVPGPNPGQGPGREGQVPAGGMRVRLHCCRDDRGAGAWGSRHGVLVSREESGRGHGQRRWVARTEVVAEVVAR